MLADRLEGMHLSAGDLGATGVPFEERQHTGRVGLGGPVGEGRDGEVNCVNFGVDCREVSADSEAGGVVGVNPDWDF